MANQDPKYNETCCEAHNVSSICMGNCMSGTTISIETRNFCSQFNDIIKSCITNNVEDGVKGMYK